MAPARELTRPEGVTALIMLFEVSATYTTPEESTPTPEGLSKEARDPTPSQLPPHVELPFPAREVAIQEHEG